MHFVYVLYSISANKYYIGECEDLNTRIKQHQSGYYTDSYTAGIQDWELHFSVDCENRTQARKIESHIKRMKSRKYLENLKKYQEMTVKLKSKYANGSQSR
jgi:putative endonuclease